MPDPGGALGLPTAIVAFLFDLDGVLTKTASVHAAAWKEAFDQVLGRWGRQHGQAPAPFDEHDDYLRFVDGRRREDGVRTFLAARGIDLPEGDDGDDGDVMSIHGVATLKNDLLTERIARDGVDVYDGSVDYLHRVADAGLPRAVVSSSANTAEVLKVTGLDAYFETRVDGVVMAERSIPSKPDPAAFLYAAELLGVRPDQAAVFEDALSGVAAGRAGHFGVVVGVDRSGQADELRHAGADIVVGDLSELLMNEGT